MVFRVVAKLLYIVLVIIEVLVALRFVFTLISANPRNDFVALVYDWTDGIVQPFRGIVDNSISLWGFEIDLVALVALLIIMLISYGLIEIMKTFEEK